MRNGHKKGHKKGTSKKVPLYGWLFRILDALQGGNKLKNHKNSFVPSVI